MSLWGAGYLGCLLRNVSTRRILTLFVLPSPLPKIPFQRIEKERRASFEAAQAPGSVDSTVILSRCRSLFAYSPQRPDELAMEVGDIILVERKGDDGWWSGVIQGVGGEPDRRGMFPGNYGEPC